MAPADATRIAYQVVLGREPDETGRTTWEGLLASGMKHRELVDSLIASSEFAQRLGSQRPTTRVSSEERTLLVPLKQGGSLYVASWDRLISGVILETGEWEPHITSLLRRIVRRGSLFIDVGANVGYFTVLAAQLVGAEGRVIAFEPLPVNVQLLLGSVVENGFKHVDVWPLALSDRSAIMGLRTDTWNTNASLASPEEFAGHETTWAVAVPGDSVLNSLGHNGPCVMKLDVESHEQEVLNGLEGFLEAKHPTIVLEFNPEMIRATGGDAEAHLTWLFERFPTVGWVDPMGHVNPLMSVSAVFERWSAVNSNAFPTEFAVHIDLVAAHTIP